MTNKNIQSAGISVRSKVLSGVCSSLPISMYDLEQFTNYYKSTRCAMQCTPNDTECQSNAFGITLEDCTEVFHRPYAYCLDYAIQVFNSEILPLINLYS